MDCFVLSSSAPVRDSLAGGGDESEEKKTQTGRESLTHLSGRRHVTPAPCFDTGAFRKLRRPHVCSANPTPPICLFTLIPLLGLLQLICQVGPRQQINRSHTNYMQPIYSRSAAVTRYAAASDYPCASFLLLLWL